MSSREWRYAGAVFIGVFFDAVFFWKFRPYSLREHGPDLLPWYFLPILAFLGGLLLTVAVEGKKALDTGGDACRILHGKRGPYHCGLFSRSD